ncbi:hypothetical protein [Brytella acorum]|uniref:Uncharacterized protein n=1 Tax=Brytella acorum TaxID=2959299 RepID=A0AA35V9P1_9PROT|nr:hypothetical protein [Brytella acorum]CAI9119534.1 hypothetical protein LMG32879_000351 [Brytella acorum]
MTDASYQASIATGGIYVNGVTQGQASSQQANKTWRQSTAFSAALGQMIVTYVNADANDGQSTTTLVTNLSYAIRHLGQTKPFDSAFSAAIGGYPAGAVLADTTTPGVLWISTADNNTTTPGASGSSWTRMLASSDVVLRLTGTNTIGVENLGWDATDDVLVATDTGGAVHTVLPSAQRAITNGTATDFGDQKELNFYIGEISGSGTQISFPESFTALPTINLTPTSETGTNLAITVNVVKGSLTNSGVLVNINNGPATASTAGCGLWVRAFGAK